MARWRGRAVPIALPLRNPLPCPLIILQRCQLAYSARLVRCGGTGGLLTFASLLETTVASRTFGSPTAIGLIQSRLGGLLEPAPARDPLVRTDILAVGNSFGIVLTSRYCLEMVIQLLPRIPLRHLLPDHGDDVYSRTHSCRYNHASLINL